MNRWHGSTRERGRGVSLGFRSRQSLPCSFASRISSGSVDTRTAARSAAPSAEDQLAVDRALAEVDLTALRDRRLGTLSGGERRRALLARALAQDARLLLLDEPTTMLDLAHGMAFFGRIAKLAREQNKAIIATTHDLNLASQFADQILLLDRGVVASSGDASRVLRREVLEPVYGPDLECGELPSAAACGTRPFVLSWRRS